MIITARPCCSNGQPGAGGGVKNDSNKIHIYYKACTPNQPQLIVITPPDACRGIVSLRKASRLSWKRYLLLLTTSTHSPRRHSPSFKPPCARSALFFFFYRKYADAVERRRHPRGGRTDLTHTLAGTHSAAAVMGKGPSVWERRREGSMEQRKNAVQDERRQKPPVFPTVLQTRLAWELRRATADTLTHSERLHTISLSGVIKGRNSVYPGNINKHLWENHTLWLREE